MELTLPAVFPVVAVTATLLLSTALSLVALAGRASFARTPHVLPGLRPGEAVPQLELRTIDDEPCCVPSSVRPTVLIFADSRCNTCATLMSTLNALVPEVGSRYQVLVVSPGSVENARRFRAATSALAPIIADEGLIAATYRVNVSPIAALLGTDGHVVTMTRPSAHAVPDLLARLANAQPA